MSLIRAFRSFVLLFISTSYLISCAQPAPLIRMAHNANATERAALMNEITRKIVVEGLGYPVELVDTQSTDILGSVIAERIDVALFVENAEPRGVPVQCTDMSTQAVSFGNSSDNDATTKIVRCDLSSKAQDLFEMLSKIKFFAADLDDALFWREDNKATLAQCATYFLHNNEVGKSGWKKWVNEGHVSSVKAAIARDIEACALQF